MGNVSGPQGFKVFMIKSFEMDRPLELPVTYGCSGWKNLIEMNHAGNLAT